jgi:hypothetical protein
LNRAQAIQVYREILMLSQNVGFYTINLKFSEQDDPMAQNYQLHIDMYPDSFTSGQIELVAKKYQLAVKQLNGRVVVYEPKKIFNII